MQIQKNIKIKEQSLFSFELKKDIVTVTVDNGI